MSLNPHDILKQCLGAYQTLLEQRDWEEPLLRVADMLQLVRQGKQRIYVAGNGGSAANASHLTLHLQETGVEAVDLMAQTPLLTALSNDHGYEDALTQQLVLLGKDGDGLVVFTVSGLSPNIVSVIRTAKVLQMTTAGFVGRDGNAVGPYCDQLVLCHTAEYSPVEDFHSFCIHVLKRLLTNRSYQC